MAMTIQNRTVFQPQDIVSIRLACVKCNCDLQWHKDNDPINFPRQCPICAHSWTSMSEDYWTWVRRLMKVVNEPEGAQCFVQLELDRE